MKHWCGNHVSKGRSLHMMLPTVLRWSLPSIGACLSLLCDRARSGPNHFGATLSLRTKRPHYRRPSSSDSSGDLSRTTILSTARCSSRRACARSTPRAWMWKHLKAIVEQKLTEEILKLLDTNHDGTLTAEEKQKCPDYHLRA